MTEDGDIKFGERFAQVIGMACVAAVLLSIWPGWTWIACIFMKDGAPAWIQAVGSVAAIYFAAAGTRKQIKSSFEFRRVEALENNRNMARTCFEIAGGLVSVSKSCSYYASNGAKVPHERVNDLQETLRVLLTKEMPAELVKNIFSLQKILGDYKEALIVIDAPDKIRVSGLFVGPSSFSISHRKLVNSVLGVRNELKIYMKQLDERISG